MTYANAVTLTGWKAWRHMHCRERRGAHVEHVSGVGRREGRAPQLARSGEGLDSAVVE